MAEYGAKRLALHLPQIVLMGNLSCRVEYYKRIVQFEPEHIAIEAVGMVVHIDGQELMLSSLTEDCISVAGNIAQVRYER